MYGQDDQDPYATPYPGGGGQGQPAQYVIDWYQSNMGRPPNDQELAEAQSPGFNFGALGNSAEALAYQNSQYGPGGAQMPVAAPTPGGGGGGGAVVGGGGNLGDFNAPFPGDHGNGVDDVPVFQFDDFHAPTQGEVENDQGYQFTKGQGLQALSQNQAASGLANTGGSIKDFINYGQSLASTRYNDVFSRNKSVYDTNYRGALDAFNPKMVAWATNAAANQHGNDAAWQRVMDDWGRRFQMAQA